MSQENSTCWRSESTKSVSQTKIHWAVCNKDEKNTCLATLKDHRGNIRALYNMTECRLRWLDKVQLPRKYFACFGWGYSNIKSEMVEERRVLGDPCNLYSKILKGEMCVIDNIIERLPVISDIWGLLSLEKSKLVEWRSWGERGGKKRWQEQFGFLHLASVQGLETVLVGRELWNTYALVRGCIRLAVQLMGYAK